MKASIDQRMYGYLIDLVPMAGISVGVYFMLPTARHALQMSWPYVVGVYFLMRDITGASVGKRLLGLRVVDLKGGDAGYEGRMLRNAPIAVGPILQPFLGQLSAIVLLADIGFLLFRGERLGDRLARTAVITGRTKPSRTAV